MNNKILNRPKFNIGIFLAESKILFLEMRETKVPVVEAENNKKENENNKKTEKGRDKLTKEEIDNLTTGGLKEDLAVLKKNAEADLRKLLGKISGDNKISDFSNDIEKLPVFLQGQVKEFFNKLSDLEKENTLDSEKVEALNNLIGIIETQDNYDQEKENVNYVELNKSFNVGDYLNLPENQRLNKISNYQETSNKLTVGKMLEIDFKGNNQLEQQVTAGNTLPEHVRSIEVKHTNQKTQSTDVLKGVRDGLTGEFWTLPDANGKRERLKIFTGTTVTILEPDKANSLEIAKMNVDEKNRDLINKLPENIQKDPNSMNIVKMSIEKGLDYEFMLAVAKKENGAKGKEFGVLLDGVDTSDEGKDNFEQQALMAMTILSRYEDQFHKDFPNEPMKGANDKYSPLFVAYFSEKYSPSAINQNDLKNLNALYFKGEEPSIEEAKKVQNKVLDQQFTSALPSAPTLGTNSLENIPERLKNLNESEIDQFLVSRKIAGFWDANKEGNPSIELLDPKFKRMIVDLIISFRGKTDIKLSSGYRPMDEDRGLSKKGNYDPERKSHPKGLAVDIVPPMKESDIGKFFQENYGLTWSREKGQDMQILSHGTHGGPTNHTHIGLLNADYDSKKAYLTSDVFQGKNNKTA